MDAQQGSRPDAGTHGHSGHDGEGQATGAAGIRSTAGEGLSRAAEAAHRAGLWAEERGGPIGRAAPQAHQLEERLGRASSYVRHRDLDGLRADLEREVDRNPVRALAVAALTGFLLGRVLR
ncbi:MAG TPA: hypothetical protein VMK65_08710 [Longimicrobiales bacterium]|nr:hypothetical protein [Longimicrobiales bacterium]